MELLQEALDRLDNGNLWTKGTSFDGERRCLLGAIGNATSADYIFAATKNTATVEAVAAAANVVRSQYPDVLVGHLDNIPDLSVCRIFNDSLDTTWEDVRCVLEKAIVDDRV